MVACSNELVASNDGGIQITDGDADSTGSSSGGETGSDREGDGSGTTGNPFDPEVDDECNDGSCEDAPRCGDGILDDDESCDDGNQVPGDGCSGVCELEPNYRCQTPGERCVSTIECGDAEIGAGEGCDDGNDVGGDGCSSSCLVEPGYGCAAPGIPCEETAVAVCSNSIVEFPEGCDDGNLVEGDGCSAACTRENGFFCPVPGAACVEDEFCGNGVLAAPTEVCDDGNTRPGDGCNGVCRPEPFFSCPVAGALCVSQIVCGDGQVIGDEACDDGRQCEDGTDCSADAAVCDAIGTGTCAPRGGDGCAANCQVVEPGFRCPTAAGVGGTCIAIPDPECGDGRRDRDEFCDDGNLTPGDGCTDECEIELGFDCAEAGRACIRRQRCGDGRTSIGESCDDGSVCDDGFDCSDDPGVCETRDAGVCAPVGGDGCSVTCAIEAGNQCPPEGGPCVSTVVCGDGVLSSPETCDLGGLCEDGLTDCTFDPSLCAGIGNGACLHDDREGCVACDAQPGFVCRPGGICNSICGDGLVVGLEQCDDGRSCDDGQTCSDTLVCNVGECLPRSADGCDDTCALEPGFACPFEGQACVPTVCGDGVAEGLEQCDDRNTILGDGCNPFCESEPLCDFGPCVSQCGDAMRFDTEECDDGNNRDGDGCSAGCEVEVGFRCSESADLPQFLEIPIVIRDFHGIDGADPPEEHVDFEAEGNELLVDDTNIVRNTGSVCFSDDAGDADPANDRIRGGDLGCAGETFAMRNNAGDVLATISMAGRPVFLRDTCDLNENPNPDDDPPNKCTDTVTDVDSFHQWFTDRPVGVDAPQWNANPTVVTRLPLANGNFDDQNVGFVAGGDTFAFDSNFMSIEDPDPFGVQEGFFPIDDFGFTGASCDSPDGELDHNFHFTSEVRHWFEFDASVEPTLTFSGDDDVFVYVNGFLALDIGGIHPREEASFTINAPNAALWGLRDGNIYEIAVFQAERNQCASNYRLTLDQFLPTRSECESRCGDGEVASTEECDDGDIDNDGRFGGCNPDCTLAPFCGDGLVTTSAGEVCDSGAAFSVYGGREELCGPDCRLAPFCGDANIDGIFGEACDEGVANNDGRFGGCNEDCTLAAFCGDGFVTTPEECDDGDLVNGTAQSECRSDCALKCGDGAVDVGEECDEGDLNRDAYDSCRTDCTLGPRCGDGIRQAAEGEECDDGLNDGSYGTCAPGCVPGPRCGDDVVQEVAGEICDNGDANVDTGYGDPDGCTTRCFPLGFCGDRAVTDAETCDDGVNNGQPGFCNTNCIGFNPLDTCGDGNVDAGEECDEGDDNGARNGECDPNCRLQCGNGIADRGEQCDDGVNDGSYGSCEADCTFAGFCGDGETNGPEECDAGGEDQEDYGEEFCTPSCRQAPFCGDGRIQTAFGEECDGQSNCNSECRMFIG